MNLRLWTSSFCSTVSSAINAIACVLLEDFVKPHSNWKDNTYKWFSKSMTIEISMSSSLYLSTTCKLLYLKKTS